MVHQIVIVCVQFTQGRLTVLLTPERNFQAVYFGALKLIAVLLTPEESTLVARWRKPRGK